MMRIAQELYDEIVSHARAVAPQECCGIVSSSDGDAVKVYRATNVLASPFSFQIDGREQIQIYNDIEAAGLEHGAIYHSHTRSAPLPSLTDIEFAKGWPGVLWIIVGLETGEPEVRTWLIDDGNVSDAQLVVE